LGYVHQRIRVKAHGQNRRREKRNGYGQAFSFRVERGLVGSWKSSEECALFCTRKNSRKAHSGEEQIIQKNQAIHARRTPKNKRRTTVFTRNASLKENRGRRKHVHAGREKGNYLAVSKADESSCRGELFEGEVLEKEMCCAQEEDLGDTGGRGIGARSK